MNRFHFWGQTLREEHTIWQNMKFDHNKWDKEHFTYDLKVLGKMIGMSGDQVLEHFKAYFPAKIEAQLIKNNDIYTAIGKSRVLALLFT